MNEVSPEFAGKGESRAGTAPEPSVLRSSHLASSFVKMLRIVLFFVSVVEDLYSEVVSGFQPLFLPSVSK